jgi:hypothetical protein
VTVIAQPVNTPESWSDRAARAATSHDAAGWTLAGQQERFAAVRDALSPRQFDSVLDWGCGTGEFSSWLPADVSYVGYDSAKGMVIRAGHEHPSRRFQAFWPAEHFDLVACVGPFNLADRWSKQHTFHTIRHLWDTTNCRTLAASLYAGDDPNCLSYTADELDTLGRQLGYDTYVARIRHNDLLFVARR